VECALVETRFRFSRDRAAVAAWRRILRCRHHINDNPAYYYNYAFATVFKFQLHDYIARKILHQPPQSCNYADNKEVGTWLNNILKKGGTEDWRKVLKEATGEDISTRAMMDYFKPLMSWLEEQNKDRQIDWD
jgi:peptidyl-dipeptidase A